MALTEDKKIFTILVSNSLPLCVIGVQEVISMSDKGYSLYIRHLEGDEQALEALVRLYSDPLIRFAYCYVQNASEAEDIMEDTIVALILKRLRLTSGDALHGYLYKTARNKAIDYLRKHRCVPLEDVEAVLTVGDAESDVFRRARSQAIYRSMQMLPEQYREVLHLTYFEGFTPAEVSRILRKTPKQVYNLLTRSKNALRDILTKEGITHEELF